MAKRSSRPVAPGGPGVASWRETQSGFQHCPSLTLSSHSCPFCESCANKATGPALACGSTPISVWLL